MATDDRSPTVMLPDQCACIVLAGGRSSRMGRDKAALPLGGVALLAHVVARVAPLVREIIVVAASGQDLPATAGARIVRDPVPGAGPLPALAAGLAAIATPWAFALACDAPFVRLELLRALAGEADGSSTVVPTRAVVPMWGERLQPLVALYARALGPALDALVASGEHRLHAVATLPGVRVVSAALLVVHDPDGASFRALNTPDEYADALRRFTATPG